MLVKCWTHLPILHHFDCKRRFTRPYIYLKLIPKNDLWLGEVSLWFVVRPTEGYQAFLLFWHSLYYKLREYLSTNELKMTYFSLVYSHLQYAIGAWGSATKTSLHRLNTIHNKIIKTISWSSFRCHVTPVYRQLNLLKLEDIHQLEIAKLMHNFHSNRMPNTFDRLFTAVNCVHTHETRSSTSYFCHPVCSQYGKRSNSKAQESGSK